MGRRKLQKNMPELTIWEFTTYNGSEKVSIVRISIASGRAGGGGGYESPRRGTKVSQECMSVALIVFLFFEF